MWPDAVVTQWTSGQPWRISASLYEHRNRKYYPWEDHHDVYGYVAGANKIRREKSIMHCKKSFLKIKEYIHEGANLKFYIPEFFNLKLLIPEYSPI
jgi:hypothetical protein